MEKKYTESLLKNSYFIFNIKKKIKAHLIFDNTIANSKVRYNNVLKN